MTFYRFNLYRLIKGTLAFLTADKLLEKNGKAID